MGAEYHPPATPRRPLTLPSPLSTGAREQSIIGAALRGGKSNACGDCVLLIEQSGCAPVSGCGAGVGGGDCARGLGFGLWGKSYRVYGSFGGCGAGGGW